MYNYTPAPRVPKTTSEVKAEGLYPKTLDIFSQKIIVLPYKKLLFITLRDPIQRMNMNKVQMWVRKFSNTYCIVQSPKNGIHYHILAVRDRSPPFLKGSVHVDVQTVGDKTERLHVPKMSHYNPHPYIKGLVGELLIDVCIEIRSMNGGSVSTPLERVRAMRSRNRSITKKRCHIHNIIDYLLQNYHENEHPMLYDHIIVKFVP